MPIRVEFFGIARQRAGLSAAEMSLSTDTATLGEVLAFVSTAAPALGCSGMMVDGRLHPTLAANLDGRQFISDPATPIRDGQSLLILSADAGG